MKNIKLLLVGFLLSFNGFGQTTILSESIGNTGINGESITNHESNSAFDEVALTYSGTGAVVNSQFSSGYATASGSRNIFLNGTRTFIIDGINATSYNNIDLSFGIKKSLTTEDGSGVVIEYSTSGASGPYTSIAFPVLPTGPTIDTAIWYYRTISTIPSDITTIRFRSTNIPFSIFRLDDILLEGILPDCSNLFISEYVEGSSSNKYIEIYNPTSSDIVLTGNYSLEIYSNGSATVTSTVNLIGTILANDVFVVGNTSATLVTADQTSGSINFNGDDAVLLKDGVSIIDSFGQVGVDPGTNWSGACGTAEQTLVRNNTVLNGDTNSTDVFNTDAEWTCFPQDNVIDLGSHTSDCLASNEIQLQQPTGTDVNCGYTYDYGIQSIGTDTDVVVTIQNTGTLDLTISNLSFTTGTNFSLVSAPALPLVIAGGGNQDITIRFNPNSLGVFNDTLTITNDDSNEGSCSIILEGEGSSSCSTTTTIIAAQDFEMAASDTWVYTPNHAAITNFWYETTSLSNITSAQSGTTFWGITDLDRGGHTGLTHEIPFNNTDISVFNNVELSFYYYTVDVDGSDSLEYELFYDSVSQGIVDISANTISWTQVQVSIPDTVNNVEIIFYADLDAANDQAGIDNLVISSTSIDEAVWTGGAWSNVTGPTSTLSARISDNYNTSVANPGFIACSVIVDSGFTLTVDENYTVEIENDVANNGTITVLTDGSFIQNNDLATFSNTAGTSTVTKMSAFASDWLEYTYWSSPVQGETIGNALSPADSNRRFRFRGENFRDSAAETNNDGVLVNGVYDNEDDNGNDWLLMGAGDTMLPAVGYAATLSTISFNPPMAGVQLQIAHTFSGEFNNGVFPVTIYKNVTETNDTNWNFIGNPYPSAISVIDFLDENEYSLTNTAGTIDGVIYFWSHQNPPSGTVNGNSQNNFSQSDYAMRNRVAGVSGGDNNGDGIVNMLDEPNGFIPSGQGFFVSYNETASSTLFSNALPEGTVNQGTVTFRNAMRTTGNNSQFFRNSNPPIDENKLWLYLSSDTGVSSQIAIGYVENASDDLDSASYDAVRNLSIGNNTFLYSTITNSNENFAIQGKAPESLTLDEVIHLGLYTTITDVVIYNISISHFEGDFFNNNTIYLKDNYTNTIHDLTASDYSFASESGEFTDRFEIVFNANSLSTNGFNITENEITIIELQNDNVKFTVPSTMTIKSVNIIDVLGREIYKFHGNKNTETYNLSNLNSAPYIAQITLDNGKVITKKAVKK